MQVIFTRWSTEPARRRPVAINPTRVDCTEHVSDAARANDIQSQIWTGDPNCHSITIPACTRIVMMGKQEYLVEGAVDEVADKINRSIG